MFDDVKMRLVKQTNTIIKVAAFFAAITAIAGGYSFFVNNVWKPSVKVISVDFERGIALVELPFGKQLQMIGSSEFLIGGDWGVKFGTTIINGKTIYDRIELVKKGMVVEYLETLNS